MRLRNIAVVLVFFVAASCAAGPSPVGTLAMSGRAKLSGVVVPDGTLVFPNDVVESFLYKSLLTLPAGDSFNLAPFSRIRVTKSGNASVIELLQGASGVRLRSAEVRLLASNWSVRANPDVSSGQAAANVIRGADGAVILAVREGQLVASRGGEVLLASANWPVLLPAAAAQQAGQPLTALLPSRRPAGSGAFTLTVNGSNFVSGSVVRWNGSDRPTKFVSGTRLTASIGAGDVAVPGAVQVTVANPSGAVSNPLVFTVYAGGAAPPGGAPAPPGAIGTGKAVVIGAGVAAVAGVAVGVSRLQTKNDTATEQARLTAAQGAVAQQLQSQIQSLINSLPPAQQGQAQQALAQLQQAVAAVQTAQQALAANPSNPTLQANLAAAQQALASAIANGIGVGIAAPVSSP